MLGNILKNFCQRTQQRGFLNTCITYGHMLRWNLALKNPEREFLVRRIQGYRMLLPLRVPGIGDHLNKFGHREPEHLFIVKDTLRESMCVLDIGGNIGYYALMAAKLVGPEGKVYTIEPHPDNCRILRMAVKLNGWEDRIDIKELAISSEIGTREFRIANSSNLHSFHDHSLDPGLRGTDKITNESITVKTVTLASVLDNERTPDFIRMDVEGHEVEILNSMAGLALEQSWFPSILFETHSCYYDDHDHDIRTPLKKLFELGYRPAWIASLAEPAAPFRSLGYTPATHVRSIQSRMGLYNNVSPEHTLDLITQLGTTRCMLLERDTSNSASATS